MSQQVLSVADSYFMQMLCRGMPNPSMEQTREMFRRHTSLLGHYGDREIRLPETTFHCLDGATHMGGAHGIMGQVKHVTLRRNVVGFIGCSCSIDGLVQRRQKQRAVEGLLQEVHDAQ